MNPNTRKTTGITVWSSTRYELFKLKEKLPIESHRKNKAYNDVIVFLIKYFKEKENLQ